MAMNSLRTRHSRTSCFGRTFVVWMVCLITVPILVITGAYLIRPPDAERASSEGEKLLQAGERGAAAEEFRRAIALDPRVDRAWHGLLAAQPTLDVCRQFADARPELFDLCQPVRDESILIREPGWTLERWQSSLALYEKIVLAEPAAAGDDTAALLRLDFTGRKEVTGAWDEMQRLVDEFSTTLREPLPPAVMAAYATYDMEVAQSAIAGVLRYFRTPSLWLDHFSRLRAAAKQYESGLEHLEQAAKLDPRFLPTQLTLAYIEATRGRAEAAAQRCRKLLEARTGSLAEPRIRCALARALEVSGNPKDAAAEIESVLRMRPADRDVLLRLASLYLQLDRIGEAGRLAGTVLQQHPGDTRASYIQGVVDLHFGNNAEAVAQLKKALRDDPGNVNIRFSLARATEATGERISAFREFMAIAPLVRGEKRGWVCAAGSATALAAGEGVDAVKAAERVLADTATTAAHPGLLAHARRLRFAAAAMHGADLLAGLSIDAVGTEGPRDELDNYLVGGVLAGRGYAAADVKVAPDERHLAFFRAQPKSASAHYSLAFVLAARGQEAQAREVLQKLAVAHPEHQLGTLHLARLHLIEGKTELAARTLQRIKRAERSPEIVREMALIDSLQGMRAPDGAAGLPAEAGVSDMLGPHLAFFAVAVHIDHRELARRVVLLDPASGVARDILKLTYPHVRQHGLDGIAMAAKADKAIDQAISRLAARYRAGGGKLYRLAIGSFWDDLPARL